MKEYEVEVTISRVEKWTVNASSETEAENMVKYGSENLKQQKVFPTVFPEQIKNIYVNPNDGL